ncbi:MAG: GspH/FimT family pseudopilin [Pseudomonas sp.]|uniref:GspH/FimT family pseudopilin n=1 Tax=Pseudomonas sp. TaxID=306 RepID=UPI00339A394E
MRHSGFTLLETLVVLTILGLAMAVVAPAINRGLKPSLDDVARDMQIDLRKARGQAVTRQQSTLLWVDVEGRVYGLERGKPHSIPDGISIRTKVAATETRGPRAGVRFFADGSSSGGTLQLAQGDARVAVEIDWLTGRVSLSEANE